MPAAVAELHESNAGKRGQDRTKRYLVTDATTYDDACDAVEGVAPSAIGSLVRQPVDVAPIEGFDNAWFATVEYATVDSSPFELGEEEFSLDMTGGSATITQAREHKADYALSGFGTAPNHHGAINVSRSSSGELSVEGVDYPIPSMEFTRTIYVAPEDMTEAYIRKVYLAKGCHNNAEWVVTTDDGVTFTFAAGEATFLGASMSKRGRVGNWPIVQRFKAEPNLTSATIAGFTGVNKLGSDYIWFEFTPDKDNTAKKMVAKAVYAHVEGLGDPYDFSELVPVGDDYGPPPPDTGGGG